MIVYFLLSCSKCKWFLKSNGTTEALKGLVEFKPCATCHGIRKFKCPQCANIMKLQRVNVKEPDVKESPDVGS